LDDSNLSTIKNLYNSKSGVTADIIPALHYLNSDDELQYDDKKKKTITFKKIAKEDGSNNTPPPNESSVINLGDEKQNN